MTDIMKTIIKYLYCILEFASVTFCWMQRRADTYKIEFMYNNTLNRTPGMLTISLQQSNQILIPLSL